MKPRRIVRPILILILVFGFISGCNVRINTTPTFESATQAASSTPLVKIPDETNTLTPTRESAPKTPVPSPSATSEQPTATSEPTLPVDIAIEKLLNELINNCDCRFPCVLGFIPGETTVKTILAFQSRFEGISELFVSNDSGTASFTVPQGEHDLVFTLDYFQKNSVVDKFVIETFVVSQVRSNNSQSDQSAYVGKAFQTLSGKGVLQYYLPSNILTTYGRPSKVLIGGFYDDRQPADKADWEFSVVLDYSDQGFVLEYLIYGKPDGKYFTGCPLDASFIHGWFVEHRANGKIENIIGTDGESMGGINPLNLSWFKPIETAASMTLDEFYDSFNDPTDKGCIRTPIDLWRP
jgi:hypothetical protein